MVFWFTLGVSDKGLFTFLHENIMNSRLANVSCVFEEAANTSRDIGIW